MTETYIIDRAKSWLGDSFDEDTRKLVQQLIDQNGTELTDSFYRDLEFGTGGLRGIMGVGTNRMNKYTVGMATQGLANYLKAMFPTLNPVKFVVSHDCRNNSKYFARIVAEVMSANGFRVYLFEDLRPTPELSFAIRHLGCQSGVMITASHNPKEYNGYKAYWDDGAQMIFPHDENVIKEVQKITSVSDVKWKGNEQEIIILGKEIDEAYLARVQALSLSPESVAMQENLKIVYTPLHGCGRTLVPEVLKRFGFKNIHTVTEQMVPDGNFPTVHSPNPEEKNALDMGIQLAESIQADLVMATDPDADRVGIAIRDDKNQMILLNGNQTAGLLFYYVLNQWKAKGKFIGKEYIVSTIVTTQLLREIANAFNLGYFECLTGFKYIADVIRSHEKEMTYVIGGEESYGYLIGDFVRDKDAISACALIAEAAAWMACQGKSLYDLLMEIYLKFGLFKEGLISVTRKGKSGAEEIQQIMINYRQTPPAEINHSKVVVIKDYLTLKEKDNRTGAEKAIDLPKSNVLQFLTEDGSIISVRPSGTEPKIKYYFGVREQLKDISDFELTDKKLSDKINGIIHSLNLA